LESEGIVLKVNVTFPNLPSRNSVGIIERNGENPEAFSWKRQKVKMGAFWKLKQCQHRRLSVYAILSEQDASG